MALRVNHNANTFTAEIGIIPDGHSCGHITAVDGDVTLTFENGDTYVVADGETFPIWHIEEPYGPISVDATAQGASAKCYWIMS
jgi:hypothetical protein